MADSAYFNPKMETMPPEQLRAWQDERVREIVAYAYEHALGMRRVIEKAGLTPADIQSVADLAKVPVTRKDDMIDLQRADPPFGGFLGIPLSDVKRLYLSPGPLYDAEGPVPDYWRFAQGLYAAGLRKGDIVQNTAAYHMTPLGFMFDEGLRAVGCTIIPTGTGNTESQIQIIQGLGVTGYAGLPSYLMTIIEKAEAQGLDWRKDTQLTKAFVAAEPFPPSMRQAFAERGITARQGYGTAETGNLGFECQEANGWHLPYDAVVQVVDINTGQPLEPGAEGEIVATLFDKTVTLIRFGTGDLSALNTQPCPCGRTSPRLVGWLGRVGQAVKVRGMFVHPRQLAQAIKQFPAVVRYQALVTREGPRDELTIQVEPSEGANLDINALGEALHQAVKLKAVVECVNAGVIPTDAPLLKDLRTWD